ncbi:hypothetical protein GCM10029992_36770 [Glycomyces albus]
METADTPLRLIEAAFDHHARHLTAVIDGTEVNRLPDRRIGLRELETILAVDGSDEDEKDEIWAHLVARARTEPTWVTLCAGLALPGLRNACKRVAMIAPPWAEQADIEGGALEGFTAGLARLDTGKPNVVRRLCQQAYIGARRYARELNRYTDALTSLVFESRPPSPQVGHVDLVLADAKRAGAITHKGAEIIGATRIEGQELTEFAKTHNITRPAADHRRRQAEQRLIQWLQQEGVPDDSGEETGDE